MSIRLTVDSTCDLDLKALEDNNVGVAFLKAIDNSTGKEYLDRELSNSKLFGLLKLGHKFTTSCPSVGDYEKLFSESLETYDHVVHLNMSGKMSASHSTALLAAQEFEPERISIFDSKQIAMGFSSIVLNVVDYLKASPVLKDVVDYTKSCINKCELLITPNSIKYVTRTGRLDATKVKLAAAVMETFNLRIQLKMLDGILQPVGKTRGTSVSNAIKYFGDALKDLSNIDLGRIVLGYTDEEEELDELIESVPNIKKFKVIDKIKGCTVIAAHSGPSTYAIAYEKKT